MRAVIVKREKVMEGRIRMRSRSGGEETIDACSIMKHRTKETNGTNNYDAIKTRGMRETNDRRRLCERLGGVEVKRRKRKGEIKGGVEG